MSKVLTQKEMGGIIKKLGITKEILGAFIQKSSLLEEEEKINPKSFEVWQIEENKKQIKRLMFYIVGKTGELIVNISIKGKKMIRLEKIKFSKNINTKVSK